MTQLQAVQGTRLGAASSSGRKTAVKESDFAALLKGGTSKAESENNKDTTAAVDKNTGKTDSTQTAEPSKKTETQPASGSEGTEDTQKEAKDNGEQQLLNQMLAFAAGQIAAMPATQETGAGADAKASESEAKLALNGIMAAAVKEMTAKEGEQQPVLTAAEGLEQAADLLAADKEQAERPIDTKTAGQTENPSGEMSDQSRPFAAMSTSGAEQEAFSEEESDGQGLKEKAGGVKGENTGQEGQEEAALRNDSFFETQSAAAGPVQGKESLHQASASARTAYTETPASHTGQTLHLKTTEAQLGQDTAALLASRLPAGNGTLEVELEPAYLGKLTLRVAFEGGKTAVTVLASDQKTLDILSQNAGQIAHILEERTGQETVVYTPQQAETGQQGKENPSYQQNRQDREQRRQGKENDSFAQQLRLGLV